MASRFNIQNVQYGVISYNNINQQSNSQLSSFADPSSGVIFINQHYEKLFYDQRTLLACPIKEIGLQFLNQDGKELLLGINIKNQQITLSIYWNKDIQGKPQKITKTVQENLFPSSTQVYDVVQKKIWLFFNRLNRSLDIYTGDVTKPEYVSHLFNHSFQTFKEQQNLEKIQQKFEKPDPSKLPKAILKIENKFNSLYHFRFHVSEVPAVLKANEQKEVQNSSTKAKYSSIPQPPVNISDILNVHLLNIDRLYAPILAPKPSFLKPDIPGVFSVPQQLRTLYDVLQYFDLKQLPDSDKNNGYQFIKQGGWKNLPSAIQHSVTSPYKLLVTNLKQQQLDHSNLIPLGILNHLYQLKNKKPFSFINVKNTTTASQILNEIIEEKGGYIRMEILPHQGLSPGSLTVLEIWPPYSSSPIHNHGHAFGLIKVLSGQIRVQNFRQLTFSDFQSKPYLENDYKEGQYTWLSQQSYSIHRLLNPYPECCLSLQSYYHYRNTTKTVEYFSFLEREKEQNKEDEYKYFYTEYYPQNDWKNYLQFKTVRTGTKNEENDKLFITRVIQYYGLGKVKDPDYSFESFALTMKKQYDTINQRIRIVKA